MNSSVRSTSKMTNKVTLPAYEDENSFSRPYTLVQVPESFKFLVTWDIVSGGDWLGNPANIKDRGYCLIFITIT